MNSQNINYIEIWGISGNLGKYGVPGMDGNINYIEIWEIWGNMGKYVDICGNINYMGKYGKYGGIWGNMGKYQ